MFFLIRLNKYLINYLLRFSQLPSSFSSTHNKNKIEMPDAHEKCMKWINDAIKRIILKKLFVKKEEREMKEVENK